MPESTDTYMKANQNQMSLKNVHQPSTIQNDVAIKSVNLKITPGDDPMITKTSEKQEAYTKRIES